MPSILILTMLLRIYNCFEQLIAFEIFLCMHGGTFARVILMKVIAKWPDHSDQCIFVSFGPCTS